MTKVNVFDESLIPYEYISTLFNHWFMLDSTQMDYFLPIAMEAVKKGTLHPLNYVDMATIRGWRLNPEGTPSGYGLDYLTVYSRGEEPCADSCIFLAIPYNQNDEEWLKGVNEMRKEIFLEDAHSTAIKDFLLWQKSEALRSKVSFPNTIWSRPLRVKILYEDEFDKLANYMQTKATYLDYFITGKRNFDMQNRK